MNTIPGIKCPMPKGAFYCIAEFPINNTEKFCRWLLERCKINNTSVMLAPANGFYSKENITGYSKENISNYFSAIMYANQDYDAKALNHLNKIKVLHFLISFFIYRCSC